MPKCYIISINKIGFIITMNDDVQIKYYDDPPPLDKDRDAYNILSTALAISKACNSSPTRLKVMQVWLRKYDACMIRPRSGMITEIAQHVGISAQQTAIHINAIADNPTLARIFKRRHRSNSNRGKNAII